MQKCVTNASTYAMQRMNRSNDRDKKRSFVLCSRSCSSFLRVKLESLYDDDRKLPARVVHLDITTSSSSSSSSRDGRERDGFPLSEAIKCELDDDDDLVSVKYLKELIEFGAVYLSEVLDSDIDSALFVSKGVKARRTREDVRLIRGARYYARCYLHPRRFPIASANKVELWRRRIMKETDDYVVLAKPSGCPVASSVDNLKENACSIVKVLCGVDNVVHPLFRLDVTTSGVLIVAKRASAAREFSEIIRNGQVEKQYLVITKAKPKIGLLTHDFKPSEIKFSKGPRRVQMTKLDEEENWDEHNEIPSNRAILSVEEIKEISYENERLYESKIRLITGRTHQIRAQLAHEGMPIVGDSLYGCFGEEIPRVPEPEEKLGIHAYSYRVLAKTSLGPKGVEFVADNDDIWWR